MVNESENFESNRRIPYKSSVCALEKAAPRPRLELARPLRGRGRGLGGQAPGAYSARDAGEPFPESERLRESPWGPENRPSLGRVERETDRCSSFSPFLAVWSDSTMPLLKKQPFRRQQPPKDLRKVPKVVGEMKL